MPILAHIVPKPEIPSPWLDSRSLLLRTIDVSDQQPFTGGGSYAGDYDWILMPGATGLDMPPRTLITETSPSLDGGWSRGRTIDVRKVFLPLFVGSSVSHVDYLTKRARLMDFIDPIDEPDLSETDGTLDLVANSVMGERHLRCDYAGGLEGDESRDQSGTSWGKVGLDLSASDPYWRSTDETVYTFTSVAGKVFLSNTGKNPWPRRITPAVSLAGGGLSVVVPGNVPVYPIVEITGPSSSTTIAWDGPRGEATTFTVTAVASGETLVIDTNPRRRGATVNGDDQWARIGSAPQFGRLKVGEQVLGVALAGTSGASAVNVRFQAGFKTAW